MTFADFISGTPRTSGNLGLAHVTDCAHLGSIAQAGELKLRSCKVFKERLVYLFYGRPAYRAKWEGGSTADLAYARACFVLRDEVVSRAKRIFPFDTGGFRNYGSALHKSLGIADFQLNDGDHPLQVIGAFYSSLEDYFWMHPVSGRNFPISQNAVRSYYQLISAGQHEVHDDRCAAIEVQLDKPVPLKGEVLALIAPNQAFDDAALMAHLKDWGAEPRGYRITRAFNPVETTPLLMNEVDRFHRDMKWL